MDQTDEEVDHAPSEGGTRAIKVIVLLCIVLGLAYYLIPQFTGGQWTSYISGSADVQQQPHASPDYTAGYQAGYESGKVCGASYFAPGANKKLVQIVASDWERTVEAAYPHNSSEWRRG